MGSISRSREGMKGGAEGREREGRERWVVERGGERQRAVALLAAAMDGRREMTRTEGGQGSVSTAHSLTPTVTVDPEPIQQMTPSASSKEAT